MSDESHEQHPPNEPSVLDYVKSLFRPGARIQIPDFAEAAPVDVPPVDAPPASPDVQPDSPFPWRALLAVFLACAGQFFFEPPAATKGLGYAFYLAALGLLGWALYRKEWIFQLRYAPDAEGTDPLIFRPVQFFISLALGVWAFSLFNDNLFTAFNVFVWLLAIAFFLSAFWIKNPHHPSLFKRLAGWLRKDSWTLTLSRWTLFLLAATALAFFFRFTQTTRVPPEPFSDHAEKLLDVYDVSQGQTRIFFPRNTGREAIQMYWTLLVLKVFGTGFTFLSLKLGTAILGFLTLPFIYLLGKEIGGPRVALIAFVLAGIAYWPNVISRVGLRFPLYPLFVAPTLLYLLRGLRTRNRNDFLLAGIFLGLGLHGYSPFRIVPFVVAAVFLLYWLHPQSKGARKELLIWLALVALTSLYIFLPLLRYWTDNPQRFGFRAMTRLTDITTPITDPLWKIFLTNVWNALKMFNFDNGEIWVHSVMRRPALDAITAALFIFGVALVLTRYLRQRHWLDLFLLVSIPLLQLPSTLSLAFPRENPSLNRTGGAYIIVFILAALAFDGLLSSFGRGKMRTVLASLVTVFLLYVSAAQNYDLVFDQYYTDFRSRSWNTSDIGRVVQGFSEISGTTKTAWVVPFPYWVDTRLTSIWVGDPTRDMALWPAALSDSLRAPGPKLFILKADLEHPEGNDQGSLDVLARLYPNGQLRLFDSDIPGRDFWIFFVPQE
ncbi:MAG: glycosyltransferase family 39 protein [Anaerolineales bacterium]|nr:glycosyltransferase family 39 protein [Anaerolineales bacterium]